MHEDEDHPRIEAELFGEEVFDGFDRAQPVEHRAKCKRGKDDPHEHARDAERLAHRVFEHFAGHATFGDGGDKGGYSADGGAFDQGRPAVDERDHHGGKDADGQQARAQEFELFGHGHGAFFGG